MPNRLVRESYLDSERYLGTSDAACLLWHRMISLADDLGCLNAASLFLRRRLYMSPPSDTVMEKLLNELVDSDLIRIYFVDNARYAFIPRFQQRVQRMYLKHPAPPPELLEGDLDAQKKFKEIKAQGLNRTSGKQMIIGLPTARQPSEGEGEGEGEQHQLTADFDEFWSAYPRKLAKESARKAFRKLRCTPELLVTILADLSARRADPDWLKECGAFVPYPATYLNGRRWEDEPKTAATSSLFAGAR